MQVRPFEPRPFEPSMYNGPVNLSFVSVGDLPCPWCGRAVLWRIRPSEMDAYCKPHVSGGGVRCEDSAHRIFRIEEWLDWRVLCAQEAMRESESQSHGGGA